jgi:hypothetical protein
MARESVFPESAYTAYARSGTRKRVFGIRQPGMAPMMALFKDQDEGGAVSGP